MKNFTQKDINDLIFKCKTAKENGASLTTVFNAFAKKHGKASGSIRNFYYKLVGNKQKFFDDICIPSSLKPAFIEEFTRAETKSVIKTVLINKTLGKSVRKSVYELANGNDKLALRYQNKYRNALKNQPNLIKEIIVEIISERGRCYNPLAVNYFESVNLLNAE